MDKNTNSEDAVMINYLLFTLFFVVTIWTLERYKEDKNSLRMGGLVAMSVVSMFFGYMAWTDYIETTQTIVRT